MKKETLLFWMIVLLQSLTYGLSAKDAYGYLIGSSSGMSAGVYKFDTEDREKMELVSGQYYVLLGGAFADGNYYCNLAQDPQGQMSVGLSIFDLTTGNLSDPVSYRAYGCTDMTYDYSTSTMYGVMDSNYGMPAKPTLIKINLTSGEIEEIAPLSDKIVAIACTYDGKMFGLGSQANLYQIDKTDGSLTLIGNTGVSIRNQQSLEFDHTDGQLYWTGFDNNSTSFLIRLNSKTATVESRRSMPGNALLGALYIPFKLAEDKAPAQITGLKSEKSGSSVTLSWNNPGKTFHGETLTELTSIDIYRNDEKIHTIGQPSIGAETQWTDSRIDTDGMVNYTVYAVNSAGRSPGASVSIYVGKDSPTTVSGLRVVKDNQAAVLSWNAPSTGQHGGDLDPATLKYTVIRMPDHTEFTGLTETRLTDNRIEAANHYYYQVTCYNELGESQPVVSDTLLIGEALDIPYYPDFNTGFDATQWKIFNQNGDNKTWVYNGSEFSYTYSGIQDADDWLISVPLKLSGNKEYRIKYDLYAPSIGSSENFAVTMGKTGTPAGQTIVLEALESFSNKAYETRSIVFKANQPGEYCIGMHIYSLKNQFALKIKNIRIEPYGDIDLAIDSLKGESNLTTGKAYTYRINVSNNGKAAQKDFEVQLLDQNKTILATQSVHEELPAEAVRTFELSWTPETITPASLYAKVICKNDINSLNDLSRPLDIAVKPTGEDWVEVGTKEITNSLLPYGFSGKSYSSSEIIYRKNEINNSEGLIKEIAYVYQNESREVLRDKQIRIFMLNTDQVGVNEQWIAETDMVLVYEGRLTFEKGENQLRIVLDTPYYYTGKNLCVLNQKIQDPNMANVRFYAKDFPGVPRAALINNDNGIINPNEIQYSSHLSYLQLLFKTNEGGSLTGKVTYEGNAVKNAKVEITESHISTLTDDNGVYRFGYLLGGSYRIDVYPASTGIDPARMETTVEAGETTQLDIALSAKPVHKLSGKIKGINDSPAANALILIEGYEHYKALTDASGNFEIPAVYRAENYQYSVLTAGYALYTGTFSIDNQDVTLPEIGLNLIVCPPSGMTWNEENKTMKITWNEPQYATGFNYDNGLQTSALEIPNSAGTMLLGSAYRLPAVICGVSWQTAPSLAFENRLINLYILALDEAGNPVNELLFSEENIPNVDGQWNSFALPVPVEAPHGYLVATGFDTHAALATDDGSVFASGCQYIIDYSSGEIYPIESLGFKQNFLLRTDARVYNPGQEAPALPAVTYQLYRMKTADKENPAGWTLLTGQPTQALSYSDTGWENLADGDYTYALKALFVNGNVSRPLYSESILKSASGIAGTEAEPFSVYPNPASESIHLSGPVKEVSLTDLNGRKVYHGKEVRKIDVTSLSDGLYILRLDTGHTVITRKIEVRK